ncbi:hypothetical protein L1887_32281 [Cichorium endivia]|nr:hypothetical protein L1887_32281 [Cichorium endivia]
MEFSSAILKLGIPNWYRFGIFDLTGTNLTSPLLTVVVTTILQYQYHLSTKIRKFWHAIHIAMKSEMMKFLACNPFFTQCAFKDSMYSMMGTSFANLI